MSWRIEAAGGDGDDDEIGVAEGGLLVGFDVDGEVGPGEVDDASAQVAHGGRGLGVDVVEDDRAGEPWRVGEVLEEGRGPVVAAAADDADADAGHGV
jgi:hypothetical protein